MNLPLNVIILAAGQGTRMCSGTPKVLHPVAGFLMLGHVLRCVQALTPQQIYLVLSPSLETVKEEAFRLVPSARVVYQHEQKGTAHAVSMAADAFHEEGRTLILCGDTPLITPQTLTRFLEISEESQAVSVLGMEVSAPNAYGRLVLDGRGILQHIVEVKEASEEEKKITLCSSGVFILQNKYALPLLNRIGKSAVTGEFYLPEVVRLGYEMDLAPFYSTAPDAQEFKGVNTRLELAQVEALMQERLRTKAMAGGVTLLDPGSTYLSYDTVLGKDSIIEPHVFFGPHVEIASNVHVKAFSHLEGVNVASRAVIGPFARLRPGTVLEEGVRIGNFVETKEARLKKGAKVNHLSYIGDAEVGEKSNIGAGTITCNYDGYHKWQTTIGPDVFIGSNTALVAPLVVGEGAVVGAGSTITKDIPARSLTVARGKQVDIEDGASRLRTRLEKKRDEKKVKVA